VCYTSGAGSFTMIFYPPQTQSGNTFTPVAGSWLLVLNFIGTAITSVAPAAVGVTPHTSTYDGYNRAEYNSVINAAATAATVSHRIDSSGAPTYYQISSLYTLAFTTLTSFSMYVIQLATNTTNLGADGPAYRYGTDAKGEFVTIDRYPLKAFDGVTFTDMISSKTPSNSGAVNTNTPDVNAMIAADEKKCCENITKSK